MQDAQRDGGDVELDDLAGVQDASLSPTEDTQQDVETHVGNEHTQA